MNATSAVDKRERFAALHAAGLIQGPPRLPRPRGAIYVIETRPRGERVAADDLIESGFVAYTPVVKRWRNDVRRVRQELPYLPRWVFVWSDDIGRDLRAMVSARRVLGVLGRDGQPFPIPSEWVVGLLVAETWGYFDSTGKRRPQFKPKDLVRIIAGKFKGLRATLTHVDPDRCRIALDGKSIHGTMSIEPEKLEPLTVGSDGE